MHVWKPHGVDTRCHHQAWPALEPAVQKTPSAVRAGVRATIATEARRETEKLEKRCWRQRGRNQSREGLEMQGNGQRADREVWWVREVGGHFYSRGSMSLGGCPCFLLSFFLRFEGCSLSVLLPVELRGRASCVLSI